MRVCDCGLKSAAQAEKSPQLTQFKKMSRTFSVRVCDCGLKSAAQAENSPQLASPISALTIQPKAFKMSIVRFIF